MLKDRTILVTGAAQGIGAVLALGLAERGARVALADVQDCAAAVEAIRAAGGEATGIRADVSDEAACEAMVRGAVEALGPLDGIVCNAALFAALPLAPFDAIAADEWDRVMSVNVKGTWLSARAAALAMRGRGGSMVMIATNRIFAGYPNLLHYDASKGAMLALARSLAREVGADNIRVNTVAPGLTLSEGVQARPGIAERNEAIVQGRALRRTQMPEDLVGPVAFLLGPDSAAMTGQTLVVDGGSIMH